MAFDLNQPHPLSPLLWGLLLFVQFAVIVGLFRLFTLVNQWKTQVQDQHPGWLDTLRQYRKDARQANLATQSLNEEASATIRNAKNAIPLAWRIFLWAFLRQQPSV